MTNIIAFTILISLSLYLAVMMFYYKTLYKKEKKSVNFVKETLKESEIMLKKYQIQLQRALGNIDLITEELNKTKNALKSARSKNSQYKAENEALQKTIKELRSKIDALI